MGDVTRYIAGQVVKADQSDKSLTNEIGGLMLKGAAGAGIVLGTAALLPGGAFIYFLFFLIVGGFLRFK